MPFCRRPPRIAGGLQTSRLVNVNTSTTPALAKTRAHRIYWWHDRSPARPGRGDRRGGSLIGCPLLFRVALIWHASRRSPRRGEAHEGSAQLEVALPSSLTSALSDRGGAAWHEWSSAWTHTSGPRPSRSSTSGRRSWFRAGSALTGTATRRCSSSAPSGPPPATHAAPDVGTLAARRWSARLHLGRWLAQRAAMGLASTMGRSVARVLRC